MRACFPKLDCLHTKGNSGNDNIQQPGSIIDFNGYRSGHSNQGNQTSLPPQYLNSQELSEFIQTKFSNSVLSKNIKQKNIDSEVILNINQQGWEKLGINDNLEQSKIEMSVRNKIRTI